ncbi:MAG: hypothetical protein ACAH83_02625, partial [Alphaproteobacteria bacterium]
MACRFRQVLRLLRLGFLCLARLSILRLAVAGRLCAALAGIRATVPVRGLTATGTGLAFTLRATLTLGGLRAALLLLARRTWCFGFGTRRRLETFDGNLRDLA